MTELIVRIVVVAMLAGASALAGAQQMVKSTRAEIAPDPGKALTKKGEALQKWNAMSDGERKTFTLLATDSRERSAPSPSTTSPSTPAAEQPDDASK